MTLKTWISQTTRRWAAPWVQAMLQPARWMQLGALGIALLLAVNVLWLGSMPFAVGLFPNGWDKLAHVALHFVLCTALLFCVGLRRGWQAVALCSMFAALDEFAQQFSPGRSCEFADWLASVIGAVLALAAAHALAWHTKMNQLRRETAKRSALTRWLQ